MALYHYSVRICSRRNGRSATGTCAYILGKKMWDFNTGKVYDYARRKDVAYREVMLPPEAPSAFWDVQALMDAADQAERRTDARLGRVFDIALPRELDLGDWIKLVRNHVQANFTTNGHALIAAIHTGEPKTVGNQDRVPEASKERHNPHVHLLVLTRPLDANGFQPTKSRDRWLDTALSLTSWRKNWADLLNRALEERGFRDRFVSHESLARQGISREASIHMGARAMALRRKGIRTDREKRSQEIRKRNEERLRQPLVRERECTRSR